MALATLKVHAQLHHTTCKFAIVFYDTIYIRTNIVTRPSAPLPASPRVQPGGTTLRTIRA